jgi:S-DNA-T family DNA segregation ATPase FtsK/SpoIIIE
MPTRIGFRVAAKMDSRIILDQNGAETLLGEGDMLFLKPGTSDLVRAQGTFVDELEVRRIVKYLKEIAEPQFHPELTQLNQIDASDMVRDELFDDAVQIVLETKRGSVSLLQRRLSVGYARASRMIEMMAAIGVLGEYKGSQAREVMMTPEQYEQLRDKMEQQAEHEAAADEDSSQPAYINEGQREYISSDKHERE